MQIKFHIFFPNFTLFSSFKKVYINGDLETKLGFLLRQNVSVIMLKYLHTNAPGIYIFGLQKSTNGVIFGQVL